VGLIGGAFELIEGACAGEAQSFESFAAGAGCGRFIYGRLRRAPRTLFRLLYLILNGFALPTSRHQMLSPSFS
jgi:hypothetical protein